MSPLPTLTLPLPSDHPRTWRVTLNDQDITPQTNLIQFDHPLLGTLTFGLRPDGHDGWTYHETGGGGAIMTPYCFIDHELFIGVIEEKKNLQSLHAKIKTLPGGFKDPGESHHMAVRRETLEETGFDPQKHQLVQLGGSGGNPNNGFFETWDKNEGVFFFSLELQPEELNLTTRPPTLHQLKFYPFARVAKVGDMFTLSALARLIPYLQDTGRLPTF
jgi:ADP-ribose pyrophosphatase YjhB (NUDIX family)